MKERAAHDDLSSPQQRVPVPCKQPCFFYVERVPSHSSKLCASAESARLARVYAQTWEASMKRLLLLALVLLAPLAACGGEATLSTSEVVDGFRERTGDTLVRDSGGSLESRDLVDFPEAHDEDGGLTDEGFALADKYGAFSLYIVHDEGAYENLLDGRGPDDNGIYWERQTWDGIAAPSWGLAKRYGNVVLYWQGDERRETDRTWDHLDGVLTAIHEDAS